MNRIKIVPYFLFFLVLSSCSFDENKPSEAEIKPASIKGMEIIETENIKKIADFEIQEVVGGLEVPWDMVFTSEERMLITERPGRVRILENGILKVNPMHVFSDVSTSGEEGLMSMALDPNYVLNKWIYISWAYEKDNAMAVRVSRFTDTGEKLEQPFIVIEDLPAARYHAGCRLAFGPDGKLYITVGDAFNKNDAQKLTSLAGKILRLNKDGTIPSDNPYPDSPIWSYGHRNPQGIAWHPETGEFYETEHGPSVIDGPAGGDEVNHVIMGSNYGWPLVSHDKKSEGTIPPIVNFTPAQPPGSLLIYSGKIFPQFKNHLFFGSLGGQGLIRLELEENNPDKIRYWEKMKEVNLGRIRNVMEGPEGFIYFSTSNHDGRGNPAKKDDRIFRIIPKKTDS